MKRLGIVLSSELHAKVKIKAFKQGKTITAYLVDLITRDLEKEKQ